MKKYLKYITIFFFFLISLIFIFTVNRGDTYVNYGFSYAISLGEVPYKDFNLVINPFSPFLYSIGLIFNHSILTFYIEQALLLTILFYILEKILNEKVYLFLLFMLIPYPIAISTTIFPGYNFLLFFFFIILYYMESNDKDDLLIGVILGIMFLTKQTVGLIICLPSFIYLFKDRKKFVKRIIGFLIPTTIFLIYLITNNILYNWFNLCFLGLRNFKSSNAYIDYFYIILLILGLLYIILCCIRKDKKITNFEALCFSVIALPIIDYYHVSLFLLIVVFIYLTNHEIKRNMTKNIIVVISVICTIWSLITLEFFKEPMLVNYHNFPLTITSKQYYKDSTKLNKYLSQIKNRKIYLLRGSENYFYKIINDEKLNYYDLPNYGNYGYNGEKKIKNKLKKEKNCLFVIDSTLVDNKDKNQQYIKEYANLIKKNNKLIKKVGVYEVYEAK